MNFSLSYPQYDDVHCTISIMKPHTHDDDMMKSIHFSSLTLVFPNISIVWLSNLNASNNSISSRTHHKNETEREREPSNDEKIKIKMNCQKNNKDEEEKKTLNWVLGGAKYHELKAWKNMCVHDVCFEFSSSYFLAFTKDYHLNKIVATFFLW